jgi:hypothetical protein
MLTARVVVPCIHVQQMCPFSCVFWHADRFAVITNEVRFVVVHVFYRNRDLEEQEPHRILSCCVSL